MSYNKSGILFFDKILVVICLCLFIMLISLVTTQIILRYIFHAPIQGAIIYSNFIFTWLTYLGCTFVARDNEDLRVDYFINKFPNRIRTTLYWLYRLCPLLILILLSKPIYKFYEFQKGINVAGVGIPVLYFTYAFIVGFTLIAIYSFINTGSRIESIFKENYTEIAN